MKIIRQRINTNESLLYFSSPIPVIGSFYAQKNTANCEILDNILKETSANALLLTTDFLYINAPASSLEDTEAFGTAELEDYILTLSTPISAPVNNTLEKTSIILKTIIAPYLQKDGGDIEVTAIKNNVLEVRFLGNCQGCPYAQRTLKQTVEKNIIRYLPEIKEVTLV